VFPIFLKAKGAEPPAQPVFYELAANGVFEVRCTPFYRSVTRFDGEIPGLESETERVAILAPKLPASLMEEVIAFFGNVYRDCEGEGIVVLFYDPESRRYHVEVPLQTIGVSKRGQRSWVTELAVRYEQVERPAGFLRCGTIHSHADQAATASHVDCEEERYEDGIHIVVGDLDLPRLSLSAAVSVAGVRFKVPPEDLIEPFDSTSVNHDTDARWLGRVRLEVSIGRDKVRAPLTALRKLVERKGDDRGSGDPPA
jgi:hypothetical protein